MLRRRINLHDSSIYRLHPELLSLIASHLGTDDLVKMTHVSYHWRTGLLSNPCLWSTLNFANTERALTFLTRSKSATIRVFLPGTPPDDPLLLDLLGIPPSSLPLELLNRSAGRIATLEVNDYASQKELLLRTMPSLRTLQFYPNPSDALVNETTRMFFPALKTLFVGNVDPFLFSVPHLTRFRFSTGTQRERAMDALLDFLCNCPLLEELEIVHDNGFYAQRDHHVVHLPHLRAYTQHTSTDFCLGLYNMLSHPLSCSVTFHCNISSYGIEKPLLPFRSPTFLVSVKRVKLKADYAECDYASGVVEVIDAAHRRVRSTRQVTSRGVTGDSILIHAINPLYPGFIKDLDARLIETLCVEGLALWFYGRRGRVEEVLGHLEHLKTLILSGSAVEPYLRALVLAGATDMVGWRCLKLDTLIIYCPHGDPAGECTNLLETLCGVAQTRKVVGFPFRKVSVFLGWTPKPERSRWMDSDLEELRRCIETFEYVTGDDTLDWNVNDYFLDGLDHLRRN